MEVRATNNDAALVVEHLGRDLGLGIIDEQCGGGQGCEDAKFFHGVEWCSRRVGLGVSAGMRQASKGSAPADRWLTGD